MVFGVIPVAVLGLAFYVAAVPLFSPWAWRIRRTDVQVVRLVSIVVGMGFVAPDSLFLIWLALMALAGGVYPAAGRMVVRRLRIKRSSYVLTNRRLIATWRPLRAGSPIVVQATLGTLLPPTVQGALLVTGLVSADSASARGGWKSLAWPAATIAPPIFIGLANPHEVAALIGDAQVATRAPRRARGG